MAQKIQYYGSLDLNYLSRQRKLSVDRLAELAYCTPRTINRVEASNRTGNPELARKIAEALDYDFQQLFIPVDQDLIDRIAAICPITNDAAPVEGMRYYQLYVRRISWWDANLWGKTRWEGPYSETHELRSLRPLSDSGVTRLYQSGIRIINTEEEWNSFFYHATIGLMEMIIISGEAARRCVSRVLSRYAVAPEALMMSGIPDVILLGDYENTPDVFSVPPNRGSKRRGRYS